MRRRFSHYFAAEAMLMRCFCRAAYAADACCRVVFRDAAAMMLFDAFYADSDDDIAIIFRFSFRAP
jgi:hypothetical protein